jgi:hypothetical protein
MKSGQFRAVNPGHVGGRQFVGHAAAVLSLLLLLDTGCSPQKAPAPAAAARPVSAPPVARLEPGELKVFPAAIDLTTRQDRQSVVVQFLQPDGITRDVTDSAVFSIANPTLARVDKNLVLPVADGETELHISFGGHAQTIPVTIARAAIERPISFKLDVVPVFMKAGCNSGSCHGSSRGKDGFHLSLFGYDPEGDYFRLTREQIGRRINLALPDESLLLQKGLGAVPHTGGERFTTNSPLYATVRAWLDLGAPKDETNIAKVVGVEIMPKQAVIEGKGARQKLTVRAKYSDGTDRDVTSLAVFISNNDVSAKVSDDGIVTADQRGEAFVMARFGAFTVGSQVIVLPKGLDYRFPDVSENNYVDRLVYAKLKKLRLTPSELCDDATFVRRIFLDVTGSLPGPSDVRHFLADDSKDKRARLIDELLQRPEFTDLWVMKWAELLQIRSNNDLFSTKSALLYYNWLHDRISRNVPINQIARDILTATGPTFENPAANYFQIERDTLKMSENVAQVFLGMRIQCSQCHNHPFDRWTMDDYYSFAAFFPRVGRKQDEDPRQTIIFDRPDGEVKHLVGGRVMQPKFLGGDVPDIKNETRREALAKWIASPENPYFARHMGNMIWAHFLGKGVIDPVDDVRVSNPASNPELLDALGAKLTEYNYDFRKLIRDICNSRTYQLSSRPNESNALDDRNFAHASIRRLRAEVLLDAIDQVTETLDKFQGLPRGARAVQIADGNVNTYFLTTFGRATRASVCTCEVKTEPNLSQALHLLNGNTTHDKCQSGGVVRKLLKENKSTAEIIDELYLRCLARTPDDQERSKLQKFFVAEKKSEEVLNDLFWALLNSKEFIFNH